MYLSPANFPDYELIDSGGFEKLERYGQYVLSRPEPQAIWKKALPERDWNGLLHAQYRKVPVSKNASNTTDRGEWVMKKGMPEQWQVLYLCRSFPLTMRLGLTAFGHIGIFPEQASNWNYIYDTVAEIRHEKPVVLNLFAYTGAASLAARAAGAEVVHVDSVKQVIGWARENMEASRLKDIRWLVEDALKFVKREEKRGRKYHGIILDPPAYGRGPEGEKWLLDKQIDEMLQLCAQLLHNKNSFLILSMYSLSFSSLISENLVKTNFSGQLDLESGELFIPDKAGRKLPLGTFIRFRK